MVKTGRNEPCPCGSGKKYKFCCYQKNDRPEKGNILSIIIDPNRKEKVILTKDVLINQIHRDSQKIATSFDKLFIKHLEEISVELSRISKFILIAVHSPEPLENYETESLVIISNTQNTIIASIECLRRGYLVQTGILIRNAIESISTALYLIKDPKSIKAYKEGKLKSQSTISEAKKIVDGLGRAYGFFSNHFAHLGEPHRSLNPIKEFNDKNDPGALFNISSIKFATNLLYITAELAFIEKYQMGRYWNRIRKGEYEFNPSEEEREWQRKFLIT